MVNPVPNQKKKEDEEKKPVIKKTSPQERTLKEINERTAQKIDAAKLVTEFLNPDFLKQGTGPSHISDLIKTNVVPTKEKGLTLSQAEMRVARSYVRDNLLSYLPSDMAPSKKGIEESMGAITKFVFDITNSGKEKRETKKLV